MRLRTPCSILLVSAVTACTLSAQQAAAVGGRSEIFAGSELEAYLRDLQLVGLVSLYPWSIRSFSPRELDALFPADSAVHPWAHRYELRPPTPAPNTLSFDVVRPTVSARVNTTFPYGSNDGPIWAGRGVTTAVQLGFAVRYRFVSLTVAPLAFVAQNASFALMANGGTGRFVYADGMYPVDIDHPQRFGDGAYKVLDPGQTTLRFDGGPVAVGLSTANQFWGPAIDYPLILGDNAAGFPHVFLGTSHPLDFKVVRLHGRLVWGKLSQSAYSVDTVTGGLRFMSSVVGVITLPSLPGLELGGSRFVHQPWPGLTHLHVRDLLRPFGYQYQANQPGTLQDNQLASAFLRWVFPRKGIEVYAEYGREDYNQNLRDLLEEPDHIGGYGVTYGLHKVFIRPGARMVSVRAEVQSAPGLVLVSGRDRGALYVHGVLQQGHTQLGQILGSEAGLGGGGSTLAVDLYHPGGRWSAVLTREIRQNRGAFARTGQPDDRSIDLLQALSVNGLLFRGRYDLTAGLTAVYEFNRDFGADAFNLNAVVGVRANVTR